MGRRERGVQVGAPGNLRPSLVLSKLGPGYIAQMFHRAHQADPTALLLYNEILAANPGDQADAVYALVQDLLPGPDAGPCVIAVGPRLTSRARPDYTPKKQWLWTSRPDVAYEKGEPW